VVGGIVLARRVERRAVVAATVVGLVIGAEYVLGIWYAAPRFLLPAYALLAVPCAAALVAAVRRVPERARRPAVAVVVVLVAGQVLSQALVLRRAVLPANERGLRSVAAEARALERTLPLSRPCAVAGVGQQPVSFLMRCKAVTTADLASGHVPAGSQRVLLSRTAKPSRRFAGWTGTKVGYAGRHVYAFTPPSAGS
jgi:hypothetical protein